MNTQEAETQVPNFDPRTHLEEWIPEDACVIDVDYGAADDFCSRSDAWNLDEFGTDLVKALEVAGIEADSKQQTQFIVIRVKS
jgi:hypothetical protein